jgi:hypothetical protein
MTNSSPTQPSGRTPPVTIALVSIAVPAGTDARCSCACGCQVAPSRRARFRPGHDQRLKGILARAQAAGAKIEVTVDGKRRGKLLTPLDYGREVLSDSALRALLPVAS